MTLVHTNLTQVPAKTVPIDPQTNCFTPTWIAYFQNMFNRVGGGSAASNLVLEAAITAPSTGAPPPNLIINGNFSVNQRGWISGTALSSNTYGWDRWKAGGGTVIPTLSSSGNVNTMTLSGVNGSIIQVVEGLNIRTGSYTIAWTGTSLCRVNSGTYTASPLTVSLTGGTNVSVEFGTGSVSNVQMSPGTTTSSFNDIGYAAELARCQRYFWAPSNSTGGATFAFYGPATWSSVNGGFIGLRLPQTMRIAPAVAGGSSSNWYIYTPSSGVYSQITSISINSVSSADFMLVNYGTGAGGVAGQSAFFLTQSLTNLFFANAEL